MKKLILVSIFICIASISSYGQIAKGNLLLGGGGNFNFSSEDESSSFQASLSPGIGSFVTDDIVLGVNIPLTFASHKVESSSVEITGNVIGYGLNPFLRYYFFKQDKSAIFGSVSYGFSKTTTKIKYVGLSTPAEGTQSINSSAGNISLGYVYFLSENFGLEGMVGYGKYKQDDLGDDAISKITLSLGLQVYLGRGAKGSEE